MFSPLFGVTSNRPPSPPPLLPCSPFLRPGKVGGGGHTTAAASMLTSASESTQATLKISHEILLWPHSQRVPIHRAQGGKFTLARDGVHLIDLASYAFILFKGTKRREHTQTARFFMSRVIFLRFSLLSRPFQNRIVSLRRVTAAF